MRCPFRGNSGGDSDDVDDPAGSRELSSRVNLWLQEGHADIKILGHMCRYLFRQREFSKEKSFL